MEEQKLTENVVENSSVSSENEEKIEKSSKSKFRAGRVLGLAFLGLVIILAILIIPIKHRTTLGRIFDVLGAHKMAMKVDAFANRDREAGNMFAIIDAKDEKSFENAWGKAKKTNLKFESVSMKSNFSVYPMNEDFKESFNGNGSLNYNISLKDQKASFDLKGNFNVDANKLGEDFAKMLEAETPFKDGNLNGEIYLAGAIDNERAYFKPEKVNFGSKNKGVNAGISFDNLV